MIGVAFLPLVQTTLRNPRVAAASIIALRLSRDVLWTALALVAVLNTFTIQLLLSVSPTDVVLPGYFRTPLVLFVLLAGFMVVLVHATYWAGLAIGGQGDLGDLLAVVIWLQVLRAAAQLGIVVLMVLVPTLAMVASLAVAIWGLWIMLNFVVTALNLPSLGHAVAVLVLGAVGLLLGMGVLLAMIGLAAQGVFANV